MKNGKLVIVYDVDDTLNNLNSYVMGKAGVSLDIIDRFSIRHIAALSEEQQDSILELYGNPETFKNVSLLKDAYRICDIEKSGKAEVRIYSANFNKEIADIKREQLLSEIPGIADDKIHMLIVSDGYRKDDLSDADVVIEDHIVNLLEYPENVVKILIDKTHNQSEVYGIDEAQHHIIRVKSLCGAVNLVEELVRLAK